jgi:hypothetical protein
MYVRVCLFISLFLCLIVCLFVGELVTIYFNFFTIPSFADGGKAHLFPSFFFSTHSVRRLQKRHHDLESTGSGIPIKLFIQHKLLWVRVRGRHL